MRYSTGLAAALVAVAVVCLCAVGARATELTFELPDKEKQCFYEELTKDEEVTIDFQVGRCRARGTRAVVAHGPRSVPRCDARSSTAVTST